MLHFFFFYSPLRHFCDFGQWNGNWTDTKPDLTSFAYHGLMPDRWTRLCSCSFTPHSALPFKKKKQIICQLNLHANTWYKYITGCNSISPNWWLFGGGAGCFVCVCVCARGHGERLKERLAPLPVAWKRSSGSLYWWNLHRCVSCRQTLRWHKQPAQVMKTGEAQGLRNDGH